MINVEIQRYEKIIRQLDEEVHCILFKVKITVNLIVLLVLKILIEIIQGKTGLVIDIRTTSNKAHEKPK